MKKQLLLGFSLLFLVIPCSWSQDVADLAELSATDLEEDSALATQDSTFEQASFQEDFQANEISDDDLNGRQDQAEVFRSDPTDAEEEDQGLLRSLLDHEMGSFADPSTDLDNLLDFDQFDRTTDFVRVGGDLLDQPFLAATHHRVSSA